MKRLLSVLMIAFVLVGASPRAFAIFGIGDIVFDPANFEQAVQQFVQLQLQYAQLVQTYQMVRGQYDHLVWMSKRVPVNMRERYRAVATPWGNASATNTYGRTQPWILGINSGQNVHAGYAQATESLASYGEALAGVPAGQLDRIKTNYATVELTDGANIETMETIGRLRANVSFVENAIQGLEDDSLSADPAMNTEIAVLNKINAANLIALRNGQDANKLLVSLAEQRLIDAKRTRDAEARMINNDIRFRAEGKALMTAQAAGASEAMRSWRMP